MQCKQFENRFHSLLDQRQQPEKDAQLQYHAAKCPMCAATLECGQTLFAGLERQSTSFERVALPPAVSGNRQSKWRARRAWIALAGTVAAIVLFSVGAMFSGPRQQANQTEVTSLDEDHSTQFEANTVVAKNDNQGETPIGLQNKSTNSTAEEFELYREMLEGITIQMPRISHDQLQPVNEFATSLQPIATSLNVAFDVLRGSISVRSKPSSESPQASSFAIPLNALLS